MKLVITYGSFNPPTKADALLFEYMGGLHHSDTEVIILTDERFDLTHPMGLIEKREVLDAIKSKNTQVLIGYDHLINFLKNESSKYEKITIIHDSGWPNSAMRVCKELVQGIEFHLFEGTDPDSEKLDLLGSLHVGNFDLFSKYYGGPADSAVHMFNNLKDRVVWKNA